MRRIGEGPVQGLCKANKHIQAVGLIAALLAALINTLIPLAFLYLNISAYKEVEEMEQQADLLRARLQRYSFIVRELEVKNEELQLQNEQLAEENLLLRSMTVVSTGSRKSSKVAITIDDGGSEHRVEAVLDCLKEMGVKATFFPMGRWVKSEPDVWRRAVAEGHELGNHTYSHRFLTALSSSQIQVELLRWQEVVDNTLGYHYHTYFFRPPGMMGFEGKDRYYYQKMIAEAGMVPVLWDLETVYAFRNTKPTPEKVARYITGNVRGGSIILLHFTNADIGALPAIIRGIKDKGLEPVTLTELFLDRAGKVNKPAN